MHDIVAGCLFILKIYSHIYCSRFRQLNRLSKCRISICGLLQFSVCIAQSAHSKCMWIRMPKSNQITVSREGESKATAFRAWEFRFVDEDDDDEELWCTQNTVAFSNHMTNFAEGFYAAASGMRMKAKQLRCIRMCINVPRKNTWQTNVNNIKDTSNEQHGIECIRVQKASSKRNQKEWYWFTCNCLLISLMCNIWRWLTSFTNCVFEHCLQCFLPPRNFQEASTQDCMECTQQFLCCPFGFGGNVRAVMHFLLHVFACRACYIIPMALLGGSGEKQGSSLANPCNFKRQKLQQKRYISCSLIYYVPGFLSFWTLTLFYVIIHSIHAWHCSSFSFVVSPLVFAADSLS